MRLLALVFATLLAIASPVLAEEKIVSFLSDVTVNTDASLNVRETITVNAENSEIRHGILRDFPTIYTDRHGQRVIVGFDVLEVKRDGNAEPFGIESISNGKRIRIGNKDVFLDDGQHAYEITYRTTRQLGFFPAFDELYWNVTGNGWTFPIESARTIIRLPAGASISQHSEYTGRQGETGDDANVLNASSNRYEAETTRRLEPGEGFTVAVAWQKGLVTPPSDSQKWGWWISDNAGNFALILSLLASSGFFYFAWNKVGRDPARGTIIPLFSPPQGLGPADVRFIRKYGADNRTFAAALVGLAVKKRLKIADDDKVFSITKLGTPPNGQPAMTKSEAILYQSLSMGTLSLQQANNVKVRSVKTALETALKQDFDGKMFLKNLKWFAMGLGLSVICLVISALLLPAEDGMMGLFAVGWSTIWWGVIIAVGYGSLKSLSGARGIINKLSSLIGLIFLVPFVGAGVAGPVLMLFGAGSPALYMLVGTAVLLGIMNVVFFSLLRAPTVQGRELLDKIDGFRLYLTTAEEDRLNVLNPPEKTPELFERYLPYALALDCENEWNAKFAAVLAAAAAAGAAAPLWYSGSHWDAGRTGGFTDSLGSSLASSVASASTAPGSSSGSSGGGSSGGGGGGGGGSGW